MDEQFQVAVIGLGAMGSAALSALAARGISTIGFEARLPAHSLSSSHGDSRLIRLGYFEDPSYVPLLRRAYHNWRQLESRLKTRLLTTTGVLQIGSPGSEIVSGSLASCRAYSLAHEVLDKSEMAERFPAFILDDDEIGVLDPQGGYLAPEVTIAGMLRLAVEDGATVHLGEKIVALEPTKGRVVLNSDHARYAVQKVIVATGAWIAELVPGLRQKAQPIRQVVAWYQPRYRSIAEPGRMPSFIRDDGADGNYFGFPAFGNDGVKIGRHMHFSEPVDPSKPNEPINSRDTAMLDEFAARRLTDAATIRTASTTCRYTMLPNADFLIDYLPGQPEVVVCSACSGHGFKFTSVIGEILADLALDRDPSIPIPAFSFERHFGV